MFMDKKNIQIKLLYQCLSSISKIISKSLLFIWVINGEKQY